MNTQELEDFIAEALKDLKIKPLKKPLLKVSDYFDLNSLTPKKLKTISIDHYSHLKISGFGHLTFFNDGEILINESTENSTVPYEAVKNELISKLGFQDWQCVSKTIASQAKIIVLYTDAEQNEQAIMAEMKALGWIKSQVSEPKSINGFTIKIMSFDPIFQEPVNAEVKQWKYLFHISSDCNRESILKNGLIPKSCNKSFDYLPKVHFIKGNGLKYARPLATQLYMSNGNFVSKPIYSLFTVNPSELPSAIKFYYDPHYEAGVFTYDAIPKQFVKYQCSFPINF